MDIVLENCSKANTFFLPYQHEWLEFVCLGELTSNNNRIRQTLLHNYSTCLVACSACLECRKGLAHWKVSDRLRHRMQPLRQWRSRQSHFSLCQGVLYGCVPFWNQEFLNASCVRSKGNPKKGLLTTWEGSFENFESPSLLIKPYREITSSDLDALHHYLVQPSTVLSCHVANHTVIA